VSWNTSGRDNYLDCRGRGHREFGDGHDVCDNVSTTAQFNITADVQNWYNGSTNYGTIIKDSAADDGFSTVFGSKEASNAISPELDVTFVQNVTGLTGNTRQRERDAELEHSCADRYCSWL